MPIPLNISIILPVQNQGDHIYLLLIDMIKEFEYFTHYEIIVVVNNSHDYSLDQCRKASNENPAMKVFYESISGWGRAVKVGTRHSNYNKICFTNSARTTPSELKSFLIFSNQIRLANWIVKAKRISRHSFIRTLSSFIYHLEIYLLFGHWFKDINGTPKIMPKALFNSLNLNDEGNLIDLEIMLKASKRQIKIIQYPCFHNERHGGKTTTSLKSGLNMYLKVLKLRLCRLN